MSHLSLNEDQTTKDHKGPLINRVVITNNKGKTKHLDLNIRQVKCLTINNCKTFYDNLQMLCIQNNYNAHASKQTNN